LCLLLREPHLTFRALQYHTVSLTRKYRSMCMASSPFDTERAGSIRRVQALLKKHTTSSKRASNPTSAAAIPGSTSGPAAAMTSFDVVRASSLPSRRAFQGIAVDNVRLHERTEERAVLRCDCEGSGTVTISQRLQTLLQQLITDQGEAHQNHQDNIQGITLLKVTLDCLVAQTNSIYQQLQRSSHDCNTKSTCSDDNNLWLTNETYRMAPQRATAPGITCRGEKTFTTHCIHLCSTARPERSFD
jgi:hypothetical protein